MKAEKKLYLCLDCSDKCIFKSPVPELRIPSLQILQVSFNICQYFIRAQVILITHIMKEPC